VVLWAREEEVVAGVNERHENPLFLAGLTLPEALTATTDLDQALEGARVVLNAVPTQFIREVFVGRGQSLAGAELLVSASKGIELVTLLTPGEIFAEVLPGALAEGMVALSGPSFSREVARGLPTAVSAASRLPQNARLARDLFSNEVFRVYSSDDLMGVELGGALKNVIAIASGVAAGLGFGTNALAALMTRGLAEITRLGVARGGNPLTFSGLSGMGDLVLTCTGELSRNRTVGVEIGKGRKLPEILAEMKMVAEGVKTSRSARELAARQRVEMPITEQVYLTLYEEKDPREAVLELMTRDLRDERES